MAISQEIVEKVQKRLKAASYGEVRKVSAILFEEHILLSGSVSGFFFKQVAQEIVMSFGHRVRNDIIVKSRS